MKTLNKLIIVFVIFFSCSTLKNSKDGNNDLLISMEKTTCRGQCPVYSIKIYQNGKAVLNGVKYFDRIGTYHKQLSRKETGRLDKAFSRAGFFHFKDEYTQSVTDLPTTYLTYSKSGITKRIRDYYGAPPELKRLEGIIENIAINEEGWEKQ